MLYRNSNNNLKQNIMKAISKKDFYNIIGKMDVIIDVKGNYPFTTMFKLRNGNVVGKSVDVLNKKESNYFINI